MKTGLRTVSLSTAAILSRHAQKEEGGGGNKKENKHLIAVKATA